MKYTRHHLTDDQLHTLYRQLLYPRMIEEKMLRLLRGGKISKWFSGIGQEAISVGVASAVLPDEMLFTMHRNLGVFTTREVPFRRLMAQWQGKAEGFTKGRDRSFHFGATDYNIVGMISHLGPQLALADGVALAHKLREEQRISVAFTGEGGTSEGDFHEALNVAAVWDLPVLFVIENNGYGLSTPTREQYACEQLSDRAKGYGMEGYTIDGNNILEVYHKVRELAESMRERPRPVLLECVTFRMRGHEEASGTKYVPQDLMDRWAAKDPLENYEDYLLTEEVLSEQAIQDIKAELKLDIEQTVKAVFELPEIHSTSQAELEDVYAPFPNRAVAPEGDASQELRFVDAISDGLREAMRQHDNLVLMGQDIADYGGVFKITDGFLEEFGAGRVRNTPLCESAIVGIGLGLSLKGFKAMVEMQFADFVTCGFNQIVNNLAKLHYRWGGSADVVVRMPTGGGVGAGPYHSQSNEAWFTQVPGLKVLYPSTPADAKGLLAAAIADPNPVLFFEHKALYRSLSGEVPEGYYTLEIGKARVAREGHDVAIITYGACVREAEQYCDEHGIDAEIIDLRSLRPLDYDAIEAAVRKTNRVLIYHEDSLFGGIGGEIAAHIAEHLFEHLDAPVMRVGSLETPVPFAAALEEEYLASRRLGERLTSLLEY